MVETEDTEEPKRRNRSNSLTTSTDNEYQRRVPTTRSLTRSKGGNEKEESIETEEPKGETEELIEMSYKTESAWLVAAFKISVVANGWEGRWLHPSTIEAAMRRRYKFGDHFNFTASALGRAINKGCPGCDQCTMYQSHGVYRCHHHYPVKGRKKIQELRYYLYHPPSGDWNGVLKSLPMPENASQFDYVLPELPGNRKEWGRLRNIQQSYLQDLPGIPSPRLSPPRKRPFLNPDCVELHLRNLIRNDAKKKN